MPTVNDLLNELEKDRNLHIGFKGLYDGLLSAGPMLDLSLLTLVSCTSNLINIIENTRINLVNNEYANFFNSYCQYKVWRTYTATFYYNFALNYFYPGVLLPSMANFDFDSWEPFIQELLQRELQLPELLPAVSASSSAASALSGVEPGSQVHSDDVITAGSLLLSLKGAGAGLANHGLNHESSSQADTPTGEASAEVSATESVPNDTPLLAAPKYNPYASQAPVDLLSKVEQHKSKILAAFEEQKVLCDKIRTLEKKPHKPYNFFSPTEVPTEPMGQYFITAIDKLEPSQPNYRDELAKNARGLGAVVGKYTHTINQLKKKLTKLEEEDCQQSQQTSSMGYQ